MLWCRRYCGSKVQLNDKQQRYKVAVGGGRRRLVAVEVGLEGTVLGNVEVLSLVVGEDG